MTRFSWPVLALSLILTLAPAPIAHAADCTSGARILAGITFERVLPEKHRGEFGYGDVWTWTAIDADTNSCPRGR